MENSEFNITLFSLMKSQRKSIVFFSRFFSLIIFAAIISLSSCSRADMFTFAKNGAPSMIVTPGDGVLYLSWPAVSGATSYEVWYYAADNYLNTDQLAQVITGNNYVLTGLTNGTMYYVWVIAKNGDNILWHSEMISGIPSSGIYSYTVTFDSQYATTSATPSYVTVATPEVTVGTLPSVPAKIGYNCAGWFPAVNGGGTEFTGSTPVTADITVYAYWSINTVYTVTYNSSGGSAVGAQYVALPANTVVSLPAPPVITGYVFGGWYTTAGGTGTEFTETTIVSGDITVFAKWDSYSYNVTFDSQGATTLAGPATLLVSSPQTTLVLMPTDPVWPGYFFAGWYTAPYGSGTPFTMSTTVTGNITVYAKWSSGPVFTVTFDKNFAAAGGFMAPQSIADGSSAMLAANTFANSGWDFMGWSTSAIGPIVYTNGAYFNMGASSVTLYAVWQATIIFVTDGGTPVSPISVVPSMNTLGLLPTDPVRSGYIFDGWYTEIGGGGTQFTGSTIVTGNITVHAKWIPALEYTSIDVANCSVKGPNMSGIVVIPSVAPLNAGAAAGLTVKEIEANGFSGCTGLTSVTIPTSVTTIGDSAFYGCSLLDTVTGMTGVTTLGSSAFGYTKISSITIPNTVTSIGGWTFVSCTSLESVTFLGNIQVIDQSAFQDCTILDDLIIPASVNTMGMTAFAGCVGLVNLTISDGVTDISKGAFQGCTSLVNVIIPASVLSIGDNAFGGCTALMTATVNRPEPMITTAGATIFDGCGALTTINVPNGSEIAYQGASGWIGYSGKIPPP